MKDSRLTSFHNQAYENFVLVFIDGNRTQFADHLVAQGFQGGFSAADHTRDTIQESVLQSGLFFDDDTAIAITLFANLEILATKSRQANLAVRDFAAGFNDAHFFTRFQDIGQTFSSHARLEGWLSMYSLSAVD